jgi:hypothetical protein
MENNELMIPILTVIGLFLANGALVLPLFIWNRSESRADIRHMDAKLEIYIQAIRQDVKAIHDEMKDFHVRLEKQDAEYKAHLMHYHQERNRA